MIIVLAGAGVSWLMVVVAVASTLRWQFASIWGKNVDDDSVQK